jgi:NAD(P)-dependent dehydrogenase (short-subunit alcohol dehydrogenase family)
MGLVQSLYTQTFPPKPVPTIKDVPNLTGKVIIVTGGYAGIGKETARVLLSHNATVYIAARDPTKAAAAIEELHSLTGKSPIFLKLDLADLKSIKAAADEFTTKERELHVLINNAGVMAPPKEMVTNDGYDLQFGTNVLGQRYRPGLVSPALILILSLQGHFYFAKLLMPLLLSTAKSTPSGTVRVLNVSSSGAYYSSGLKFDTFKDGAPRRKLNTWDLYFQSKYGNVVITAELARRYSKDGIVSTSVNPGNIRSELQRHTPKLAYVLLNTFLLFDVSYGALTQLWAVTSKEGANLNGKFLVPWARIGRFPAGSQDERLGGELWEWCEEQVKTV